jgi:hypothetical protein
VSSYTAIGFAPTMQEFIVELTRAWYDVFAASSVSDGHA